MTPQALPQISDWAINETPPESGSHRRELTSIDEIDSCPPASPNHRYASAPEGHVKVYVLSRDNGQQIIFDTGGIGVLYLGEDGSHFLAQRAPETDPSRVPGAKPATITAYTHNLYFSRSKHD